MKKLLLGGILAVACTGGLVMAHGHPSTRPSADAACTACPSHATTQPVADAACAVGKTAAATQPAAKAEPVNKFCPVETDDKIDPNVTIVYEGKTIAFCCKDCIKDFKKDPAKYLAHMK